MDGGISVRIFPAGDFAAPDGWPADVGIAVIAGDGLQVFPVHDREGGAEALTRIAALSGLDLRAAAVHPPVAGHPACDMPFSAVADLQSAVEAFLARAPEAVDEADDFAVNFGFAVEEGISFPALAPTARTEAPAPPDAALAPDTPPPGHSALPSAPASSLPPHARPVLRLRAAGPAMVVFDPDSPVLAPVAPPVFLRDDGLGLAVARRALRGPEGVAGAILLPDGALPWLPAGAEGDLPLIATERGAHLFLSLLPEWAWPAAPLSPTPPEAEAELPTPSHPTPWIARAKAILGGWRGPATAGAVAAAIVVGLGWGAGWQGAPDAPRATAAAPVDALRAGLFD